MNAFGLFEVVHGRDGVMTCWFLCLCLSCVCVWEAGEAFGLGRISTGALV